jgi:peptidoglycan/xylan/chitin deacetylase (PgdA/CDA1 family)
MSFGLGLFAVLLLLLFLRFSFRYGWWAPAIDYQQPRILMYHMISNPKKGAKFNGLRVAPDQFERQLKWLQENRWHFITMKQLIDAGDALPSKSVALTFDDGFEDNYTNAYPLMKKYGAVGTLYLVHDRHQRDWSTNKKAHHNSGELMHEPKLSDTQVSEILESGVFELGAHTMTHANLSKLSLDEKRFEIETSKTRLEDMFNTEVSSFAYPFGIYDQQDVEIAKQSGFESAVTTEAGISTHSLSNPLELKRIKISGKDNFLAFRLRMKQGKRGYSK